MEVIIILLLILLNGFFATAEIAIVSARKSRLQQLVNEGNKNAQVALELANTPNRFLSTIQIGITLIGIFAGAFGGATIAASIAEWLRSIPMFAPYSDQIGIGAVVIGITYLTLVFGELVPKRVALNNAERIAIRVAPVMVSLSSMSSPLVYLLTLSTDSILRFLHIKPRIGDGVSEEEVKILIREGAKTGVFEVAEKDIFERTLRLSDKKVSTLMTPRKEIVWLDIDSSFSALQHKISKTPHPYYPICRGTLDKLLGVARTEDLLTHFLVEKELELQRYVHKPLYIPEGMDGLKVLELFKKSGIHMAFVVDEYGSLRGLISLNDILRGIIGDIPTVNDLEEKEIIKTEDGTWLVDGLVSIDEFKEYFHVRRFPEEKEGTFHTIGGFIMHKLGRVPVSGDIYEFDNFRFEVVGMDGNRVEKVLVAPMKKD